MKKSDITLIIGFVIVVILGIFLMGSSQSKVDYELPLPLEGDAGLIKLSYEEYKEKMENNDAFVLIVERADCSHCINYMPVAEQFATDNNVPMYYIDTDEMDNDDWNDIYTSNSFFRKNKSSWGTPTTMVLLGTSALEYIEGETDADSLMELYNKYFGLSSEEGNE